MFCIVCFSYFPLYCLLCYLVLRPQSWINSTTTSYIHLIISYAGDNCYTKDRLDDIPICMATEWSMRRRYALSSRFLSCIERSRAKSWTAWPCPLVKQSQSCSLVDRMCLFYSSLVMAPYRAGHYIFALWFLSSSSSSFFYLFPSLFSAATGYGVAWCGPSANLECMSKICCTRLSGNTGRKNRHFGTIAQIWRAISSEQRHESTIGKKMLKVDDKVEVEVEQDLTSH